MSVGVFIGRFQPFHVGHQEGILRILSECSRVVICIGSAQEGYTKDNPFTLSERTCMIGAWLVEQGLYGEKAEILGINDIHDYNRYASYVVDQIKHQLDINTADIIVYSGNETTLEIFDKAGVSTSPLPKISSISGSTIRFGISTGTISYLSHHSISHSVMNQIGIRGCERIKFLYKTNTIITKEDKEILGTISTHIPPSNLPQNDKDKLLHIIQKILQS